MKTGRQRTQALDALLDKHVAWERRTLADLRGLGFKFQTIAQAFKYRDAQKTLARLSADEVVELVAQLQSQRSK
jgi:1,6-anhydro-N-acetylmuramate kinase